MTDVEECGHEWKARSWHECSRAPGHDGAHLCGYHEEGCCTDCSERWTEPCGQSSDVLEVAA